MHRITPTINPQKESTCVFSDNLLSESKAQVTAKTPYPAEFDALWLAYPPSVYKSDKKQSFARWKKLNAADRTAFAGAVLAYAESNQAAKNDGQFVARMQNWLSGGKWRDFVTTETPTEVPVLVNWPGRLERFKQSGTWVSSWGEKPSRDGCQAPAHLLQQYGYGAKTLRLIGGGGV